MTQQDIRPLIPERTVPAAFDPRDADLRSDVRRLIDLLGRSLICQEGQEALRPGGAGAVGGGHRRRG